MVNFYTKNGVIRFIGNVYLLTFLGLSIAYCQRIKPDMTPVELAQRIFDENGFPALGNYITGDYKGHPNGKDFKQKNSKRTFKLLSQTNQNAVVALTITNKAGLGTDYYLYFVKQTIWKMQAFRSLAMAGYGLFEKNQLERLNTKQIDSIIALSERKQGVYSLFSSREDYNFKLGNARLLSLSDDGLIAFFNEHRHQFDELKKVIIAGKDEFKKNKTADIELNVKNSKVIEDRWKEACRKLFILYAPARDSDFRNSVEVVIWGMSDNSMGYVYIPDKENIPMMSPDHIILLRAMGDGWFLYKTT
ncbi:hypothetical protein GCM10028819_08350 [Spirosoma humi]